MDGWRFTLVHGFPLSKDCSLASIHPPCHLGAALQAELFQQKIQSTVANTQPEVVWEGSET